MSLLDEAEGLQSALVDVSTLAQRDLSTVWSGAQSAGFTSVEVAQAMHAATPEIVGQYSAVAADVSVSFYEGQVPASTFTATPAPPPSLAQVAASTGWALSGLSPLDRLAGAVQRMVFGSSRRTIIDNVGREDGARWARFSSSTACAFCRMLATRGDVYHSEDSALAAHNNCRCTAVAVRPGKVWTPPSYVEKWEEEYKAAVEATADGGAINTKAVLRHMDGKAPAQKVASQSNVTVVPKTKPKPVPVAKIVGREFDHDNGIAWGSRHWPYSRKSPGPLSSDEVSAVANYTGSGYARINGELRDFEALGSVSKNVKERVGLLDSALEKANRVPEPVVVTRTMSSAAVGGVVADDAVALVGREFRDKGYMSTAVEAVGEGVEATPGVEYVMRLTVPKGSRGLYVSNADAGTGQLSAFGIEENELLLARGGRYRIDGVEPAADGGFPVLKATLLGQEGDVL